MAPRRRDAGEGDWADQASGRASPSRGKAPVPRGGGSAGCLLWLIALSFIFLLFVLNWGKITDTLKRTNFNEVFKSQKQGEGQKNAPVNPATRVEAPLVAQGESSQDRSAAGTKGGRQGGAVGGRSGEALTVSPTTVIPPRTLPPTSDKPAGTDATAKNPNSSQPAKTRIATLYFVRIDDDGVIVRQEVTRAIPQSDSPLTDALMALLKGPVEEEIRKHLLSLIPQGTVLLSVQVRGSTAFLNFNEAFMYNHYGIEGYAGQLKQIVYTSTSFPTVHDVQILIDGERHDYLGGEGVYIGKPLSRTSF